MPNQPATKHRSIRINDDDWADLETAAHRAGHPDRSAVITALIRWYLHRPDADLPTRPDHASTDSP